MIIQKAYKSLRAMRDKLYHAGIKGKVSRSTLADANENRDWRIYAQVYISCYHQTTKPYHITPYCLSLHHPRI